MSIEDLIVVCLAVASYIVCIAGVLTDDNKSIIVSGAILLLLGVYSLLF